MHICYQKWKEQLQTGMDISTRPLAQASVKSVRRAEITDDLPVWRVRFFSRQEII